MHMKNIFILIDDITQTGGTERVACTLSNELYKKGYKVSLYSLKFSKKNINFELDKGVVLRSFQRENKYLALIKIMKNIKKNNGCLIVISMGRLSVDVAIASIIHRPNKVIFSEHISYKSFSGIKQAIKRVSYFFADKIVFLTKNDQMLFSKRGRKEKYYTIKNINPYFSSNISISQFEKRSNIALAVGRLTYQKNFPALIDIWSKTDTSDWELIIIGNGEEKKTLENLAEHVKNIRFLPATSNISDYYNNAKLFLMTSHYEGLPMVLIESQYFGIPSIAYDCKTGPKEIIINNETGYIIPYNNACIFSEKLKLLINDHSKLSDMHINSIKNKDQYSPGNIIGNWISLIG